MNDVKDRSEMNNTHDAGNIAELLDAQSAEKKITDCCADDSGVLFVFSLDGISDIEKACGFSSADRVVNAFVNILRSGVSEGDILGRVSPDRFVVFCKFQTDVSFPGKFTVSLNEQLKAAAEEIIGDAEVSAAVYAGAVFAPESATDYETLFKLADKALFSIKQDPKQNCAIYSKYSKFSEWRRDISSASKLFDENDINNGACRISANGFGPVYRYFVRYVQSYCRSAFKMLFTLSCDKPPYQGMTFISERFSELIAQKLRKSDLLVQLSEDQFFLVLPEITEQDAHKLAQRILNVWGNSDFSDGIELQYETEQIPISVDFQKRYRSSDK